MIRSTMSCSISVVLILICSVFVTVQAESQGQLKKQCNVYQGSWVYDQTYPLYDSTQSRFIRKKFDSMKYGRTDRFFISYRWQSTNCNLANFDGRNFLEKFRGKKIVFTGDSIYSNHLLACYMLQCPMRRLCGKQQANSQRILGVVAALHHSLFLVDVVVEPRGRVLKLNSTMSGQVWKKMDVLVFNTWQWLFCVDPRTRSVILCGHQDDVFLVSVFQVGLCPKWDADFEGHVDRMEAFRIALTTWANWVNTQVDTKKTRVFFRGVSPSQYKGEEWNEPGVTNCAKETRPINLGRISTNL